MRFEELIVQVPEDELQLRFHPQLTVLSGLGPHERESLAGTVVGSLVGGEEDTALRYVDADGEPVVVVSRGGRVSAQRPDGTPVAEPVGSVAASARHLRELVVVTADEVSTPRRRSREDEPPELAEARDTLEALAEELAAARSGQQARAGQQAALARIDDELRAARENEARREYAQVLARLERVRAEAAALESGDGDVDADRRLLEGADGVRELAAEWATAAAHLASLFEHTGGERVEDDAERAALAEVPEIVPDELPDLAEALARAAHRREQLDQRLQDLAVSRLPAPSQPAVAELGVLDQGTLWAAADRVERATAAMHDVQVSVGGLELEDIGPPPAMLAEIERAHAALEEAERALSAVRLPGVLGAGLGIAAGVLGLAVAPLLVPVGLGAAAVAGGAGIVVPTRRRDRAARVEQEALATAGASSYLGFHIRRVEASVDPNLRDNVEAATEEHRGATTAWSDLTGGSVSVEEARAVEAEVRAYHDALRDLGETADEMEHLRDELEHDAVPAWRAAREALAEACAPFRLDDADLDDPRVADLVDAQRRRGQRARAHAVLHEAEQVTQHAADRLAAVLSGLGFDSGNLDARVGALEWAVTRAEEREDARRRARPRAEIDADLATLTDAAAALRRPEWDSVTAAEASTPDVGELEARRAELVAALSVAPPEVDLDRLSDRHAALERRVAALEARHAGAGQGDPGALADLQQALLARLTAASQAGPGGDPVPVLLDEVLQRVPADRTWDLLDLLLRLSERHQLVYLTDDAFVAAWARQRALDGTILLLEPAPEPEVAEAR